MMMMPPVVDQELLVHLFAPSRGGRMAEAYQQLERLWMACREQLGMTEPIAGFPTVLPEGAHALPVSGLVAALENPAAFRQAVLRSVDGVLNMSVALGQPIPEGLRPESRGGLTPVQFPRPPVQRRLGWTDLAHIWMGACAAGTDAMIGEVRVFVARTPPGDTGVVGATAELGESLDPLLPYGDDRPQGWWKRGYTTNAGYAVWDMRPMGDTRRIREIVLFAGSDSDSELSKWAWSDGTPDIPPFAQYLMHASQLRSQARLLKVHADGVADGAETEEMLAELSGVLGEDDLDPTKTPLLHTWLSRLRAKETGLVAREAELDRLRLNNGVTQQALAVLADRGDAESTRGVFGADEQLARWLTAQIENNLKYLTNDLDRIRRVRALAVEQLSQMQRIDGKTQGDLGYRARLGGECRMTHLRDSRHQSHDDARVPFRA